MSLNSLSIFKQTGKLVEYIILTVSSLYCFRNFVAEPIVCDGPSMEPTIHDKDIILAERFSSVVFKEYKCGDIIIARSPMNPNSLICKRIAGVSGDVMRTGFLSSKLVPRGHVWLHGDNEDNSLDSREYGAVPVGLIIGKAVARIWPPSNVSLLVNTSI